MQAADEPTLLAVLQTDPFWPNGIVENLQITQWDPLFGDLRHQSSSPNGFSFESDRRCSALDIRSSRTQVVTGGGRHHSARP